MSSKRTLSLSGAALVLVGGLSYSMRRAALRTALVARVSSGTPAVASIALQYGQGARPWSVIIDLLAHNGASGSVTCDGEMTAVEVPLSLPFKGAYMLTTTATYRLLGVAKTVEQTHIGNV